MNIAYGGENGVGYLECINPRIGKWRVRWNIHPYADSETGENRGCEFCEEEFNHKPTMAEIKQVVTSWYNGQIDTAIQSGFVWKEMAVWLSTENQFNYKAAYDMAVQTGGSSLPCTFKFGTTEVPVYYTFETLDDLTDFYTQSLAYVQQCLSDGWATKGAIDFSVYEKEVTDGND